MSRALAAALALSCLLASPPALADDRDRARELFEQAAGARAEGRWEEARRLLEQALAAYPQFPIAWNLVTAVERTGDLPEAERLLERMRDGELGTMSAAEQESVLVRLDEIGARLATLRVVTSGDADTVTVDGSAVPLGTTGHARVRVIPGTHELSMLTGDGRRLDRTVDVAAGETQRVLLAAPELTDPATPVEEPADEDGSVWQSPWLWVVVGAVVLGGAATAFVLSMDGQGDPVGADFEAMGL